MLYQRLVANKRLSSLLAKYNGRPAIFYQHPAVENDAGWDNHKYPRIDYTVDMQENPARNASGLLMLHVWCDTRFGAEPEDIEYTIRDLLHSSFASADDDTYCFAWARSDAFEAKVDEDKTVHTVGVSLTFDLMACPCQYTMYPDPIKAMNQWTKTILPNAIVLGEDQIDGWIIPSREQPVVYWRLAAQGTQQKHFTHTWLNVTIEGHVYARTAADRLFNLVRINTAQALAGHIPMEDTSPLFLRSYSCKPHLNYLSQGQIQATGNFGILHPHYSDQSAIPKLNNAHVFDRRRE